MPANLNLTELRLRKFKKVDDVVIRLASTNVLIGGNNSGKSSVLQGIHFSVCAAIAARIIGGTTFTQSSLLYCPARDFVSLRHGSHYSNQSNFGHLDIKARLSDNVERSYTIRIYRGRNEGNVGCTRTGDPALAPIVGNATDLFSIYVPGLAGIPQVEEYRSESVIRRGVAGGDANLYLRNVLYLIEQRGRLQRLCDLMQTVFPGFQIRISFRAHHDVHIRVEVWHTGGDGHRCPLELAGTGVLQALQIFSYVTLFEPSLLLLDEPDAHLHPDNQGLLATTLQVISLETTTQVVLSTHSRHLVEALQGEANFVWLKGGKVVEQGSDLDRLPLLLDLGALDSFDKLQAGHIDWVILTEDSKILMLKSLLVHCGFDLDRTTVYSYKSSSNIQAALSLAAFINSIKPGTRIVVHRDRDFMTDDEVQIVREKIELSGAVPFITAGSDLESYFLSPAHLAQILEQEEGIVQLWLDQLATAGHVQLQHRFTRKRDDLKFSMYRGRFNDCPDTAELLGAVVPLPPDRRVGKEMLKMVRAQMQDRFGRSVDPLMVSPVLQCPELGQIVLADT